MTKLDKRDGSNNYLILAIQTCLIIVLIDF